MQFNGLVGQEVSISSRFLDTSGTPHSVTIHGAEPGGVWIRTEHLMNAAKDVRERVKAETGEEVELTLFLPFHAIEFAIYVHPVPFI